MKRNWLSCVAIALFLIAGTLCNTALAQNKGIKPGGGGFRPSSGGNSGISRSPGGSVRNPIGGSRVPTMTPRNSQGLGGLNNQVKKLPGNLGSSKVGSVLGATGITRQVAPNLPIINGQGGGSKFNLAGKHLDFAGKNGVSFSGGAASTHCEPCKPGCKPWWSHCIPIYTPHYKPSYVVYQQPIVVYVPAPAPVVADAPQVEAQEEPASEKPLQQLPVGATLTLASANLGDAAGQVMVQVNNIAIPATVNEWKPDAITATLPMLALASPSQAELVMVMPDGTVANSVMVELVNSQVAVK